MAKYVVYEEIRIAFREIEADSEEEAIEIARGLDRDNDGEECDTDDAFSAELDDDDEDDE